MVKRRGPGLHAASSYYEGYTGFTRSLDHGCGRSPADGENTVYAEYNHTDGTTVAVSDPVTVKLVKQDITGILSKGTTIRYGVLYRRVSVDCNDWMAGV
ncbi:MAG: hypothetical protein ACLR23_22935 [Clostridia bacterium]